ncbi:DMT family transporter [Puniceibacterium sp. IMCC21224]|uniref:DMT family transporter n=1 Tax=Puniceibacterium sp. IMCC21224 TaxID=1618204 RepID=UPI00064DAC92|nr:DMT family transporter [Puniceibacterium sp. IMCC21224]KMK67806.1 DMT(drug/metabolite transporter) superfamily permease [Puniceibacterium sp. IMCC21224]
MTTPTLRALALPLAALILCGAAWGGTQPLSKLAVSEGYRHFGLIFWQMAIGATLLGVVTVLRRRGLPYQVPHLRVYLVLALIGSVLPGIASYSAARHLPSGVLSILLSSVPMLAFPVALALGNDHFHWKRLFGLSLGMAGVLLLVLPDASLPEAAQVLWVPVALIASAFYALEGNVVARWGTAGLDPVQALCGASMAGAVITLPLALISGQFIDPRGPWGVPDLALIASSLLHVIAYTGYVWLVGATGAVFAVQVSYLVTLFGVTWAMLFLHEVYSPYIWAALGLMFGGLALVQPRPRAQLAPIMPTGNNADV